MKKLTSVALASLGMVIASTAFGNTVTLTFDGLQNQEQILNYYNGGFGGAGSGPGPNYGVTFGSDSLALNGGNYGNNPTPPGIAFFLSGVGDIMNVSAGFNTGFSFYYAAYVAGSVNVYSGLNGTGSLLATLGLPVTPNPAYVWLPIGVAFSGTAQSVVFAGAANEIGFDNVTLGASVPSTGVPDSGTTSILLGAAFLGFASLRRRLS